MRGDLHREELIQSYLLGDLNEDQQIQVEDQAFNDPEYQELITAVENDLIDEYVRGELSETQSRQFESLFLASTNRRRRIEFAKALASNAQPQTVTQTSAAETFSLRDSFFAFIRGFSPALRFAVAAAALVIIAIAGWQLFHLLPQRSQFARRDQIPQAVKSPTLVDETNKVASQLGPENNPPELKEVKRSVSRPAGPAVVSLVLLPRTLRGTETRPKLVLPSSARFARLVVKLDPQDSYEKYRLELRDQRGKQVYAANLKSRSTRVRSLSLRVPVNLLKPGTYELTLREIPPQEQTFEVLGYYYFEVSK